MSKRMKKAELEPTTGDPPLTEPANPDPPPAPTEAPPIAVNFADLHVGQGVAFFPRDRVIRAKEQGTEVEAMAAIITRINTDKEGARNGLVALAVLDPELGPIVRRDVVCGLDANQWYPAPPQVRSVKIADLVPMLKQLVEAAVEDALAEKD